LRRKLLRMNQNQIILKMILKMVLKMVLVLILILILILKMIQKKGLMKSKRYLPQEGIHQETVRVLLPPRIPPRRLPRRLQKLQMMKMNGCR
jgi:hypothetical protein